MAGQVDRDHVALGCQGVGDRIPASAGEALAVQQDQRLTPSGAVVGQSGRTRDRFRAL